MALTAAEREAIDSLNKTFGITPVPLYILQWVLVFVVTLTLLVRLYVRGIMLKSIGLDDWFLILSWVAYMLYAGSVIAMGKLFRDPGTVAALNPLIRGALAAISGYIWNMIFIKIALAALYLRVLHKKWHRQVIYYTVGFYIIWMITPFFMDIFQCGIPHPQNFLDPKKCPIKWTTLGPIDYLSAALNAIVDWIMTIIPVLVIRSLQMPRKEKIMACVLIGLGSTASVVSVVRLFYIHKLKLTGDLYFFGNLIVIGFLSTLETSIAMIAMSVSAYRPLWHKEKPSSGYTSDPGRKGYVRSAGPSISRTGPLRNISVSRDISVDVMEAGMGGHGHVVVRNDGYKPGFEHYEAMELDHSPLVDRGKY